jgi:hypothetical protein
VLADFGRNDGLSAGALVCPQSDDTPADQTTRKSLQRDFQSPGHVSYIYSGKGTRANSVSKNMVIAYEPLSNHASIAGLNGMNVLFGNGHVDWETGATVAGLLTKVAATSRPVTLP